MGEGDEPFQPGLPQLQQPDLVCQRGGLVKIRIIQHPLDVLQRKFQLPEQQNGLQPRQRCIVIQPIARLSEPGGRQQADGVVMVQRPDADPCQSADFVNGPHGSSSSVCHYHTL